MTRITVLVPTYRRPACLKGCLQALARQRRKPDEVLVLVRESDEATWAMLESLPLDAGVRAVPVSQSGVVASMNQGLSLALGDLIAITDDDAEPHPDWLLRIERHFQDDPQLGALGGRDCLFEAGVPVLGQQATVGKLQWFGRHIGQHHLGFGSPRLVDVLKGVNQSYRRAAIDPIRFDTRLRAPGDGVEMHNEMTLCLALKRAGWKVVYDPEVQVDHLQGPRVGGESRHRVSPETLKAEVHNETLAILEHLPPLNRLAFAAWAILVGTRRMPGLIQWLRLLPVEPLRAGRSLVATLAGRRGGWETWRRSRRGLQPLPQGAR